MDEQLLLPEDTLSWLLDPADPGPRYLALRDLPGIEPELDEVVLNQARRQGHISGTLAAVLDQMDPAGWWHSPGPGYNPKYRSSVWSLILLAQLGGSMEEDERIGTACRYILDHALTPGGQFSITGAPSGTIDCLQGNLCWSLAALGCRDDRLASAYEWMAQTVTGEGLAPIEDRRAPRRYYAGKCGPRFACGANNRQSCAWGAAKVMLAFSTCPPEYRTPLVENAILEGVDFLFSTDPALADYPSGYSDKPSRNWWKFGFPVFYVTDLLQIVEALAGLGYGNDPRLANAVELVRSKQDEHGRWLLEYDYQGKIGVELGEKRQPNKWLTIRALRVLQNCTPQERPAP